MSNTENIDLEHILSHEFSYECSLHRDLLMLWKEIKRHDFYAPNFPFSLAQEVLCQIVKKVDSACMFRQKKLNAIMNSYKKNLPELEDNVLDIMSQQGYEVPADILSIIHRVQASTEEFLQDMEPLYLISQDQFWNLVPGKICIVEENIFS